MKTVMRKKWLLIINVAACILFLTLLWQNASLGCWDTSETQCTDECIDKLLAKGLGGCTCFCESGSKYKTCEEESIGQCWKFYNCTQTDCEGTCTYSVTGTKYRCLTTL